MIGAIQRWLSAQTVMDMEYTKILPPFDFIQCKECGFTYSMATDNKQATSPPICYRCAHYDLGLRFNSSKRMLRDRDITLHTLQGKYDDLQEEVHRIRSNNSLDISHLENKLWSRDKEIARLKSELHSHKRRY